MIEIIGYKIGDGKDAVFIDVGEAGILLHDEVSRQSPGNGSCLLIGYEDLPYFVELFKKIIADTE